MPYSVAGIKYDVCDRCMKAGKDIGHWCEDTDRAKMKCSDINLPHWHTVTTNPTRTGLRLKVTFRYILSWSTSLSEVILNDWVGGILFTQRNNVPALEHILKHFGKIKVYYSPTNAQVIVLKTILKFTIKQLLHELHGYTVHQQCWTLLLPTDAHNVKKHRVIKTL